MSLATCPGCSRHVRITETRCPFCSAELPAITAGQRLASGARVAVAIGMIVGTGIALSACYGCPTPGCGVDDTGTDSATE